MTKKVAEIEDVLEVMTDLTTIVGDRFNDVDTHLNRVTMTLSDTNQRILSMESAQRETNERLSKLENRFYAYESDIKELYAMVTELRTDVDDKKLYGVKLEKRLSSIEAFAVLLSKKTGIKFK